MDRNRAKTVSARRRFGSVIGAVGLAALGSGLVLPAARAASPPNPTFPMQFFPETANGFTNTFTPPVTTLEPKCPEAIAGTPGSDPAEKLLNDALNNSSSFEPNGTVHYIYLDNPHASPTNFTIQDCEVVYPPTFFTSSDFNANGTLKSTFSKHDLSKNGKPVDGGDMTGISQPGQNIFFTWKVSTDSSVVPGAWVCNFARDIKGNHSGGGNRKVSPVCFEVPNPDLAISKTGNDAVISGGNITYTVTVSNTGTTAASNVTMTDDTPSGTTFVSESQGSGPTFNCSNPLVGGTGTTSCTIASLAAGVSATFTIVDKAPVTESGTSVNNSASVSADNIDADKDDTASWPTTVDPQAPPETPDVAVAKQGPSSVIAGNDVTYSITVSSTGSAPADVTMTDVVPTHTTFVSETQDSGVTFNCTTPPVDGTGTVTCSLSGMAAGTSATFTIKVHVGTDVADGTSLSNTATVSVPELDTDNDDSATVPTSVSNPADLALTKTGPDTSGPGGTLTYKVVVTNTGNGAASDVVMTDPVPNGATFLSETQDNGPVFNCTTPAVGATSGVVECDLGSMAGGATAQFTIEVNVPTTTSDGTVITNTATVTAENVTSDDDDSADVPTTIVIQSFNPPPQPTPSSTTTSPPTTLAPTIPPPTNPPAKVIVPATTAPAQVLGTQVTAAPTTTLPTAVLGEQVTRPAQLPFTGTNPRPLLWVGSAALLFGLLLVFAADPRFSRTRRDPLPVLVTPSDTEPKPERGTGWVFFAGLMAIAVIGRKAGGRRRR